MGDRKSNRVQWDNYCDGTYFVTIGTHEGRHIFGRINEKEMILNEFGEIADYAIRSIPTHHKDACVINYVVMPNHVHILIDVKGEIKDNEAHEGCLRGPKHGDKCADSHFNSRLATIIGSFKASCSREIHKRGYSIAPLWQRSFYDEIIRSCHHFDSVMYYIDANVVNWEEDPYW